MYGKIKIAALSALIGLGALAGTSGTAQADGIYFSFGSDSRAGIFHHEGDRWSRQQRPRRVRACTPGHALHKAQQMGLRRAHVSQANRNIIRVTGRSYRHGRATIIFARAPNCPVIRAMR